MRNRILILIIFITLGFVNAPAASAVSIGFSNWNGSVVAGTTYNVNVIVSGLPAGQIVSTFDLNLLFSTTMLTVQSVSFNNLLGDPDLFEVFQSANIGTLGSSGLVDFAAVSNMSDNDLYTIQSNPLNNSIVPDVTLATVRFFAEQSGLTSLAFDWSPGNDVKGRDAEIILDGDNPPVPEPGTMLLLGSGLAALVPLRRRLRS